MKNLNKKQIIVLTTLIISIFNILFLCVLGYVNINLHKKNNLVMENKISYKIDFKKHNFYLGLDESEIVYLDNDNNINYKLIIEDENIAIIENNKIIGKNYGKTEIFMVLPNNTVKTSNIYIVKGLVKKPNEFNYNKNYISCNYFSKEENELLDNALEDRVKSVTYKSRASVVEAARFLTLNFDFRLHYFYENGRLNNYGGKEHVDGEGRYYHKGLYLNESKFEDISSILMGPAIWGCPLTNITKANGYGYYIGKKYPNGFDCSGFISWVLYNGGFDIGDTGAGETYRNDDLYDLGEKTTITKEFLNSGKIKVGDLIAYSGHMAMIIGINNEKIYIAETLPHLKGLVAKEYTKDKILNTFTHVMLMDDFYKIDGKLTNMWY